MFGIDKAIKDGNGNAIIYTAIGAAILANVMPTPADGFFFYQQRINKEKLDKGEITPKQYWTRDVFGYYFYTAAWYGLVLATVAAVGGSYQTKAKILLGLSGAGIVLGVVSKNIEAENEKRGITS